MHIAALTFSANYALAYPHRYKLFLPLDVTFALKLKAYFNMRMSHRTHFLNKDSAKVHISAHQNMHKPTPYRRKLSFQLWQFESSSLKVINHRNHLAWKSSITGLSWQQLPVAPTIFSPPFPKEHSFWSEWSGTNLTLNWIDLFSGGYISSPPWSHWFTPPPPHLERYAPYSTPPGTLMPATLACSFSFHK